VVIEYGYFLPDSYEAATVPATPPYTVKLLNAPIKEIVGISAASGRDYALLGKDAYSIDPAAGTVSFSDKTAGKVVEFTYYGGKIANAVFGSFLSEGLATSRKPERWKLVSIEEIYGTQVNRLKISFLKGRGAR
jgi:hypothetical protein